MEGVRIDCIIVSHNDGIIGAELTETALNTLYSSERNIRLGAIVIETGHFKKYECDTYHYSKQFNYNACLNLGISKTSADYVALCNNDLFFYPYWADTLISEMMRTGADSACPFSPHNPHPQQYRANGNTVEGWRIGHEFLGWCVVLSRKAIEGIGKLSEAVDFWYSDNILADQLQKAGMKHVLVPKSIVDHVKNGSNTLMKKPHGTIHQLTGAQKIKYDVERERLFKGD